MSLETSSEIRVVLRSNSFGSKKSHQNRNSAVKLQPLRRSSSKTEYCLLGVDLVAGGGHDDLQIGLVLRLLYGTQISLDGDGGFSIGVLSQQFIFKPKCLQNFWITLQLLHSVTASLEPSMTGEESWPDWTVSSPQSCVNEWNEMPDISIRRPPSPSIHLDMKDGQEAALVIKSQLRNIMKTVDLDNVTSRSIRLQLERDLNRNLEDYKSFIDEEILLILGQMDSASEIFEFLYLGSEWNASNLEEMTQNRITHVLNVTREIDNFYPAVFTYLNIREYDTEETDLLKFWDRTFNFIQSCQAGGGRVLVHCKMGISRSAATVAAFAMKYYGWSLSRTMELLKTKRKIVKPNDGFLAQLITYEGILEASRKRQCFRNRSMSDTFCKSDFANRNIQSINETSFKFAKENLLKNLYLRNINTELNS